MQYFFFGMDVVVVEAEVEVEAEATVAENNTTNRRIGQNMSRFQRQSIKRRIIYIIVC